MENKFKKLISWISTSFQLITVGLLVFAVLLILKQQNDIRYLKSKIDNVESNLSSKIDDVEGNLSSKIDDVESDLSSEIDGVKSTVRIWSN
jgi:hypothetical protein